MNNINYVEWDSNAFGYKIGEICDLTLGINEILKNAKDQKYRLLYLRHNQNDVLNINGNLLQKGILVDEKVTYLKNIEEHPFNDNQYTELYQENIVSTELYNLAMQSGIYSRFKIDKNFENKEFELLYAAWIENSVKKIIAKKVIIQNQNHKTIGLLTLGIKHERADIGMLAVDINNRGKGIGKNLIERSFFESKLLNQNNIQVITQKANKDACVFYEKMGFALEKTENIYHFWI